MVKSLELAYPDTLKAYVLDSILAPILPVWYYHSV